MQNLPMNGYSLSFIFFPTCHVYYFLMDYSTANKKTIMALFSLHYPISCIIFRRRTVTTSITILPTATETLVSWEHKIHSSKENIPHLSSHSSFFQPHVIVLVTLQHPYQQNPSAALKNKQQFDYELSLRQNLPGRLLLPKFLILPRIPCCSCDPSPPVLSVIVASPPPPL
mmetsp:Transcript_6000/g.8212  ORF Transcript_6000/g.8212 Transcript_6000/m.8212 type:complete len:171 (-) Transcript_6000:514-1026(-)